MRKSILIAAVVALSAAGWILSGQFGQREQPAQAESADVATPAEAPPRAVRVSSVAPRRWKRTIAVHGRTEASRSVQIRAETAGRIVQIGTKEGQPVGIGATIARIDPAERLAALAEAKGLLKQREMEHKAAKSLSQKGFRADTQVAAAEAQLEAARARVVQIETDIMRTTLTAPFGGVLDTRAVELGAYLEVGDTVATLVDLDPLLVVGSVSEREIGDLAVGARARATLVSGRELEGQIRYISSVADSSTRTFRVEIEIPNPDGAVRHGLTAQIQLPLTPVMAHFISPSVLTLDERGRVGVKLVTADKRVAFAPVEILADTPDGAWIGGLDGQVTLITVGQGYVREGQKVEPVAEAMEGAS